MKAVSILLTVPAALLLGSAAFAQAPAAQPQAQSQAQQPAYDASEIVCQKQEVTGSRLAVRRVCMTRGQWLESQMSDKSELEAIQRRGDAQSK
jgi:hypothetical protein